MTIGEIEELTGRLRKDQPNKCFHLMAHVNGAGGWPMLCERAKGHDGEHKITLIQDGLLRLLAPRVPTIAAESK